jgi:zinc/manganese transport system ATP-binding protein
VSAIVLDRATIALGGRAILSAVNLSVAEGEFVGVLGANGAGKTTLLRALLGLIRPATGTISVFGVPAGRDNAAVGYLPQTRAAPANLRLSAYDFLASSIRGQRWGLPLARGDDRREIERVVDLVEAGGLVHRPLATLSGG